MARRREGGAWGTNRGEKARVSWERNLGRDEVVIGGKSPGILGVEGREGGQFSRIAVSASINWN